MDDTKRPHLTGAGASAQARYAELWSAGRRRRLATATAIVLAVALLAWLLVGLRIAIAAACVTAAAVTLYRARRHDDAAAWRKGAAGERRTARMLAPLARAGYVVLHDRSLPRGRANVDHLVIGACGVVVIDSKNWHRRTRISSGRGRIWIGKRPADKVVSALRYETESVSRALTQALGRSVSTTPLVAVHGARLPRWGALAVSGVTMLRARRARGWIRHLPAELTPRQVAEVSEWADRLFPVKAD